MIKGIVITASCLLVSAAFSASPVATITSASQIQVRGATFDAAGIPSWPLLTGDTIRTFSSPATIRFSDGSSVVLGSFGQARIEQLGSNVVFRVGSGTVANANMKSPLVKVWGGQPAPIVSTTGSLGAPAAGTSIAKRLSQR